MEPNQNNFSELGKAWRPLKLTIDGKIFEGSIEDGAVCVEIENKSDGIFLDALILQADSCPQNGKALAGVYPHLGIYATVPDGGGQAYECHSRLDERRFVPLKNVLFGKVSISMVQRLILSLSIAAAFAELEEVLPSHSGMVLKLEDFWVEKGSCAVRLNLLHMMEEYTQEEKQVAAQELRQRGLLPPECYEEAELPLSSVEVLRHMLAVLIFRCLTAADPFDGRDTLLRYPYRSDAALGHIYGSDAVYVGAKGGGNPTDAYIGGHVIPVMERICSSLTELFSQVFCEHLNDPQQRPTAEQWLNNQKRMVEWVMFSERDWIVPDLKSGEGAPGTVACLCVDNGTEVALSGNRPVFQYMLEQEEEPLSEKVVGVVTYHNQAIGLKFKSPDKGEVLLREGASIKLEGRTCTLKRRRWPKNA